MGLTRTSPVPFLALALRARCFHVSALRSKRFAKPFILADIGEGITECEVLKWHIRPPTAVLTFDPLCEVQSDKATVEITSPFDGTLKEICVEEGQVAKVGDKLCWIEVEQEDTADTEEAESMPLEATEPTAPSPIPTPAPAAETTRRPHPLDPSAPPMLLTSHNPDILATPSVRHFARQQGLSDLSVVGSGSGKGGRIEKADVERFLAEGKERGQKPERTGLIPETVKEEDKVVELGRTRWAMYKSMTASLQIPHFGYSTTLDLTALHHFLPTFNAHIPSHFLPPPSQPHAPSAVSPHGIFGSSPPSSIPSDPLMHYTRLTHLPFIIKALAHAMLSWPLFRCSISPTSASTLASDRPTLTLRPHADISIALSTSSGLYTPTIPAVDSLSPYEIAGALKRFQSLGRQTPPALGPREFGRGGTIAVSNVGAIGQGEYASPLLVPGIGLAIVAIGRAKWVDEVEGGEHGETRRRLKVGVSWAGDHRVIEGAELAAFVEEWRHWVEKPERMIAAGR